MSTTSRTRWRRAVSTVMLSLALLLGGAPAASASTQAADSLLAAQPAPTPPCTGPDCIPQPTTAPPPADPGAGQPADGENTRAECGITSIGGCVTNAITSFFRDLVTAALNPLLGLLSASLLSTPSPESLPRVAELWTQSWQILLACYALLVMTAGVLLVAYESLQTRYSIKEIVPRLVVGFLAGALNLFLATKAITLANALVTAVVGDGLDARSVGETMKNMILAPLGGGEIFILLLGVFLVIALAVLLITYLVRVALTLILIAGGPLAMMCHALPQTEGVAYWWWRAFGGCLAIQLTQSLALITGLRVFLAPGAFTPFGATRSALVNLLVMLALLYILIKIPFWILDSLRIGGGRRSLVSTVVRAYVIGHALGWVTGRHTGHAGGRRPPPPHGGGGPRGGGRPSGGGGPHGGGPHGGGPRSGSGPRGGHGPHGGGGPPNDGAPPDAGASRQPDRPGPVPSTNAPGAGRRAPQRHSVPPRRPRPGPSTTRLHPTQSTHPGRHLQHRHRPHR